MSAFRTLTYLALSAAVAGCGTSSSDPVAGRVKGKPRNGFFGEGAGLRLDQPSDTTTRRAALALDDIEPRPALPAPATTRAAAKPAPAEALMLYAQARRSLIDGQRFTAIKQLEQAIGIDPLSPAPYLLLAEAQLGEGTFNDKSIRSLETASELDPTNADTRVELGRQYLAKGDVQRAIAHLRLAMATPRYREHEDVAATTDLFLAKALEKGGYSRAAIERYERLLSRVKTRDLSLRKDPELALLVANPDLIAMDIGRLYEAGGQYERALAALEPVASEAPDNFDLQARVARLLKLVGRSDEAMARSVELLTRFRASRASVELMREIGRGANSGDGGALVHLRRLANANPTDRAILFALSDTLRAEGHEDEATQILVEALGKQSANIEITRRLFGVYDAKNDVKAAATLLLRTIAQQPESTSELAPLWDDLTRLARPKRLGVADVAALDVPVEARAAKLYFQAESTQQMGRSATVRETLERAVAQLPVFPPAYRALHGQIWADEVSDLQEKQRLSRALATRAKRGGDAALAMELQGLTQLAQNDATAAATTLSEAVRAGGSSPDRILTAARAHATAGDVRKAEGLLWKLISDHPTCEAAYTSLFTQYLQRGDTMAAVKIVSRWLAADPSNVNARLLQASVFRQSSHNEAAEEVLLNLVNEHPSNSAVLADLYGFYVSNGRIEAYVSKLEALRAADPSNYVAGEMLVETYAQMQRFPDAARVLDALRTNAVEAGGADADALYYFAGLYTGIRQPETAEELLEVAVKQDPKHAPANNDLGYALADAGRNLERAESMVRVAVNADPTNASYLDSLGWVLYKRGRFTDAQQYLQMAADASETADPIVLDHLGDAFYRQQEKDDATATWKRSLERINEDDSTRADLQELKLRLLQKLKQAEAGQAVNVAPTAQPATAPRVGVRHE
ncbi:MAG TPA: tetratricopeptide repeat protein [Tepidisphaeraceae bacterium]|jgi:Tfp pilus assembly protein PilF|nr:tetratricopeptide repeat protein [Tepidisphaeraceae bacterium]